jgi:hypothetical protein
LVLYLNNLIYFGINFIEFLAMKDNTNLHKSEEYQNYNSFANKNMLHDASLKPVEVELDGKKYLKFRLWVHELLKLASDEPRQEIIPDETYFLKERIEWLENKIIAQQNIIQSVTQLRKNQEREHEIQLNIKIRTINELREKKNSKNSQSKIKSLEDSIHLLKGFINTKELEIKNIHKNYKNQEEKLKNSNAAQSETIRKHRSFIKEKNKAFIELQTIYHELKKNMTKEKNVLNILFQQLNISMKSEKKLNDNIIAQTIVQAEKGEMNLFKLTQYILQSLTILNKIRVSQDQSMTTLKQIGESLERLKIEPKP